jgi:hypothetical protein
MNTEIIDDEFENDENDTFDNLESDIDDDDELSSDGGFIWQF